MNLEEQLTELKQKILDQLSVDISNEGTVGRSLSNIFTGLLITAVVASVESTIDYLVANPDVYSSLKTLAGIS